MFFFLLCLGPGLVPSLQRKGKSLGRVGPSKGFGQPGPDPSYIEGGLARPFDRPNIPTQPSYEKRSSTISSYPTKVWYSSQSKIEVTINQTREQPHLTVGRMCIGDFSRFHNVFCCIQTHEYHH